MTREEIAAWRKRWKSVNDREIEELRSATQEEKFIQLAALMASVDFFGWRKGLEEDDEIGYRRWQHLRQQYARRQASPA